MRPGRRQPSGESPSAYSAGEAVSQQLIRNLAVGAHHLPTIRSWLRPAHFTNPAHAQIYTLICDMHAAGQPIDPVTIVWAAARHGIPAEPADLEDGTATFAIHSAREVRRLGLLTHTARIAIDITMAAAESQQ
jgi:hypothetical protein